MRDAPQTSRPYRQSAACARCGWVLRRVRPSRASPALPSSARARPRPSRLRRRVRPRRASQAPPARRVSVCARHGAPPAAVHAGGQRRCDAGARCCRASRPSGCAVCPAANPEGRLETPRPTLTLPIAGRRRRRGAPPADPAPDQPRRGAEGHGASRQPRPVGCTARGTAPRRV